MGSAPRRWAQVPNNNLDKPATIQNVMFVYKQFCFHVGVYYNGLAVLSIIPTASCSTHYWPAIYHLMGVCGRRNPGSSLFLSMDSASCRKSKTQTALLALFLRAFAKADAGPAAVLVD